MSNRTHETSEESVEAVSNDAHVTYKKLKYSQEVQWYGDLLIGLPKEVWGDRMRYELRSDLQTAWQQLYGNIDSTYSKAGQVCPADEPKMFSAAQQVKYYQERLQVAQEESRGASESDEIDDAKMDLELAEHRLDMREQKFGALLQIWQDYVGVTGADKWEYKAWAERKSSRAKRSVGNDELRANLNKRREALANAHLTDAEQMDATGESA